MGIILYWELLGSNIVMFPPLRLRIIVSDINENRNFLQQNLAASLYELAYSLHFFFFLKFWLVEMIGFAPYIEAPDVHKQLVFW